MKKPNIAILGATGVVGREILKIMDELKVEYNQLNKIELTDERISIKEHCIPIKIDRIGNFKMLL